MLYGFRWFMLPETGRAGTSAAGQKRSFADDCFPERIQICDFSVSNVTKSADRGRLAHEYTSVIPPLNIRLKLGSNLLDSCRSEGKCSEQQLFNLCVQPQSDFHHCGDLTKL
jgi:hypothetical protein